MVCVRLGEYAAGGVPICITGAGEDSECVCTVFNGSVSALVAKSGLGVGGRGFDIAGKEGDVGVGGKEEKVGVVGEKSSLVGDKFVEKVGDSGVRGGETSKDMNW